MIRTAIPFGYMFIGIFLIVIFVGGIATFLFGWRRRSLIAKWVGGGMVGIVTAVVVSEIAFEHEPEWNPTIKSDTEIIGTWAGHGQTIMLAGNKTFSYQTLPTAVTGTWNRDDWNLYLRGDGYSNTMRFIQFRGRYRLMTHPMEDPDMWDGDLGLQHQ